jgi:rubrerythrin
MEDRYSELEVARKRSLVCGGCGYGILRASPPDRCPMCQSENAWVDARPLSVALLTG